MAVFYVDGSVGVSGDGSSGNPFKTLLDAQVQAVAGNTIYIRPGTYSAGDAMNNNWTKDLGGGTRASGSSGSPITWAKDPSAAAGSVIINGAARKLSSGSIVSYVTFDGLKFTNGGVYWQGISTSSRFTGLVVKNCEISGGCIEQDSVSGQDISNAAGIFVSDAIGCTIQDCTIHDIDVFNGSAHGGTPVKYYRGRGSLLEHCYIYNWLANERAYNAKEGCEDNIIRRCLFRSGGTARFFLDWCNQADGVSGVWDEGHEVYENIFIGQASDSGESAVLYNRNRGLDLSFYNNTLFNCGLVYQVAILNDATSVFTNYSYHSNIISDSNASAHYFTSFSRRNGCEPTSMNYNCWHGSCHFLENRDNAGVPADGEESIQNFATLADFKAHHGTTYEQNGITSDPLFVSTTSGSEDFNLQAGSPCRNAGQGGVDMGAYPRRDGTVIGPRTSIAVAAPVRARRMGSSGRGRFA